MSEYGDVSSKDKVIESLKMIGAITLQAFASGLAMAAGGYVFGRIAGGKVELPNEPLNVTPLRKVGT